MPRWTSDSISSMSEPGSMTTPQPITHRRPLCRMPEGIVCSTYLSRPTTTVWPALLPPEKRTTTSTCGVMMSTTLPLPSSPHCAPMTTMFLDMSCPSQSLETLGRVREDVGHPEHALAAAAQIEREQLAGGRARAADHQHVAHALRARVIDGFFEPATDDVPSDGRPEIPQPSGQGQRRRLFGREVDDEEIGSRQLDGHLLALHDGQRPRDVEGEADGRTVVAEPPEHVVVAATARQRGAEAGDVGLEVEAGVIVEAADLAEVEQHGVGQPIDSQKTVHLGQVGERALRARILRVAPGALQHDLAPEQRRQRQERLRHVRRRRQLAHEALERRGVLAGERVADRAAAPDVDRGLLQQAPEKVGMPEVDLEAVEAERAQPLDGHRDDLDLRLRLLEPDQLHPGLVELAVV